MKTQTHPTVRAPSDIDDLMKVIRSSAARAQNWLSVQTGDSLDFFRQMKYEAVGFHPIEDRKINLVEQINQTWTFVAALAGARQLFKLHPNIGGFHLAPGAHASLDLDIMSEVEGMVGAEAFAAVTPRNNQKLVGDMTKLALRSETYHLGDFCSALDAFGHGSWSKFYDVADIADEISLSRPFYPRRSSSAARQIHLLEAHGCRSIEDLLRRCERATTSRRAACSLFWTLGGNQVGKAAISGWKEIVGPARRLGAKLWPFEGSLEALAKTGGLVLAETYPAEAYGHVGLKFSTSESKRRQNDRAKVAADVVSRTLSNNIALSPELSSLIGEGFGPRADGEDAFDAVMGLFGMIAVVEGRRLEGPSRRSKWEGWILGQSE
jgi:hypothetical protein